MGPAQSDHAYYLRHELRANGMSDEVVKTIGNAYLLRRDAVWLDADAFERLVTEGRMRCRTRRSGAMR